MAKDLSAKMDKLIKKNKWDKIAEILPEVNLAARKNAARACAGEIPEKFRLASKEVVKKLVSDSDNDVQIAAINAIGAIGDPKDATWLRHVAASFSADPAKKDVIEAVNHIAHDLNNI